MISISSTTLKNAFGKYLNLVLVEGEIVITKNNRPIAKLVRLISDKVTDEEKKEKDNS